ncbi:MAG: sigma-E factor negative regulatory protein [Betaproteobacteria bacterium]|nr:sigma-E factor negative regulatory protein [Betaproteobacteria bacterium]
MTQELSTLMDGELDAHEAERAIRTVCGNDDLKQKWHEYHLIGDALRGDGPGRTALSRRIMAALEEEPTVLAPRRRIPVNAGRIAFAAAASVTTVAVVGWMGLQQGRVPDAGPALAKGPAAAQPAAVAATTRPANVNEYLVVHRQLPNADFYRPVSNTAAAGR